MKCSYSMPFGAEVREDGSVRFRLWAPEAHRVELWLENAEQEHFPLAQREQGWFEVVTCRAGAGTRYRFRVDDEVPVPDPASRFQPCDVHGPSEVVDSRAFEWQDDRWRGRPWEEAVIYELHVGAFTPEGTFRAVEQKLDYLCELGVSAVELMPVADFPGARNWGYDGVLLYAPDSSYGRPEDLKRLVQAAHARALMIFLDVVYNHFGPDGNYLRVYAPQFFTNRHSTPWGDGINFDGPGSRVVRDFFIHNALYWLKEYRFDGLRLDATHAIVDDSAPDIVTELAQTVRARFDRERFIHLILENADNAAHYLHRDPKRHVSLYDAQWNDDIHHALHVLVTGESDGYYADYSRRPVCQLCRCLAKGFAFQGEYSEYHDTKRGEPSTGLPPSAFVSFLQNHDQVGNRAFGERVLKLASSAAVKAAMEILLLAPSPPLLFMGEEFAVASPFLFFSDFQGDLASTVTAGRRNEFARFAKFESSAMRNQIPDPNAEQTFLRSKLDWQSLAREPHVGWLQLYQKLLTIRQRTIFPCLKDISEARVQFCDSETCSFAIAWIFGDRARLHLRANLSSEPVRMLNQESGCRIYCSAQAAPAIEQGRLPAWSVVWSLEQ
jgi:maltooligosyltrehalose trehalohydrolase